MEKQIEKKSRFKIETLEPRIAPSLVNVLGGSGGDSTGDGSAAGRGSAVVNTGDITISPTVNVSA